MQFHYFTKRPCRQMRTVGKHEICGVYTCGSNNYGQLGHYHTNHMTQHELISFFARHNIIIVKAAAGPTHSLFLSNKGDVYAVGANSNGELGLEGSPHENESTITQPLLIPPFSTGKIIDVSAGDGFSLFLTDLGQVFCCGRSRVTKWLLASSDKYKKQCVNIKERVKKIYGSSTSAAIITESNTLHYCAADCIFTHCGKVKDITFVENDCCFLTDLGVIYYGWYAKQEGFSVFKQAPQDTSKVVAIAGGSRFLVSLTQSGRLYMNGAISKSTYYYWDSQSNSCELGPCKLLQLDSQGSILPKFKAIWGNVNTLLALSEKNVLYGFGRNYSGSLGNGTRVSIPKPEEIVELPSRSVQVSISSGHSIIVVQPNEHLFETFRQVPYFTDVSFYFRK